MIRIDPQGRDCQDGLLLLQAERGVVQQLVACTRAAQWTEASCELEACRT